VALMQASSGKITHLKRYAQNESCADWRKLYSKNPMVTFPSGAKRCQMGLIHHFEDALGMVASLHQIREAASNLEQLSASTATYPRVHDDAY